MAAKTIPPTLRNFPSVEELLQAYAKSIVAHSIPRQVAANLVREVLVDAKATFRKEKLFSKSALGAALETRLRSHARQRLQSVINATGVLVHTNLGRSPLPPGCSSEITALATTYNTLEFDLASGQRGRRGVVAEEYLGALAGSEAALIVNNCAAALVIILNTFAQKKEVVISRGELVQIGGGFRIPDILSKAGGKLHEIGTTNITTIKDYKSALNEKTGLILKVHKSNFVQSGFSEEVAIRDIVTLASKHNTLVVHDLGSGLLISTQKLLGHSEPTVQQSVQSGAHLTCFSGDKLFGGMQAGFIVGKRDLIEQLRKNPLYRALRPDKMVFASVERIAKYYLDSVHMEEIPLWGLLGIQESKLYKRARQIVDDLGRPPQLSVRGTQAQIGGGAMPEKPIPSVAIHFSSPPKPSVLSDSFRALPLPIIGRIEDQSFLLDLKAVFPEQDKLLTDSIRAVLSTLGSN